MRHVALGVPAAVLITRDIREADVVRHLAVLRLGNALSQRANLQLAGVPCSFRLRVAVAAEVGCSACAVPDRANRRRRCSWSFREADIVEVLEADAHRLC